MGSIMVKGLGNVQGFSLLPSSTLDRASTKGFDIERTTEIDPLQAMDVSNKDLIRVKLVSLYSVS